MTWLEYIHARRIHTRRVRVLSEHLGELIPARASVLDVGCGDGLLAHLIRLRRPDIDVRGIDVLLRGQTYIPVEQFDGCNIPCGDRSLDVVMFVDVLHHTEDPLVLFHEGMRVARKALVIKDHTLKGVLASRTLRFMDRVGNARHGVKLTYTYWSQQKWLEACKTPGLKISVWKTNLKLYPWLADWIFGRSLHFIARLDLIRANGCAVV